MPGIFRERLLKGRTAFITGGGSGINLEIARRFAKHGAKVMLLGQTREKLERACEGLRKAGGEAEFRAADVRDYAAQAEAFRFTRERFGEVDTVVCGAAGKVAGDERWGAFKLKLEKQFETSKPFIGIIEL